MNAEIAIVLSIIVVAAILLFAAGPIVATHQTLAWGEYDDGCGGCGGGYFYGGSGFYNSW